MKHKKTIIVVITALVLFFSAGFLVRIISQFRNKKIGSIIQKNNLVVKSSKEETSTAKEILSWLDSQKDDRGTYYHMRLCNKSNKCSDTPPSNRSGFAVLWARYRYILATNDQDQISKLKTDIDNYNKILTTETGLIQNNHYSCYFLYDISLASFLSSDDKAKLKNICMSGQYEIAENPFSFEIYQNVPEYLKNTKKVTEENKLKSDLSENIDIILNNKTTSREKIKISDIIINYPYFVSDLVAKSEFSGESRFMNSANYLFNISLIQYIDIYDQLNASQKAATGLAALDLYRVNKDEKYLRLAKHIFEKEKDVSNYNFYSAMHYRLFMEALANTTSDKKILSKREEMDNIVLKNYHKNYLGNVTDNKVISGVVYMPGQTDVVMELIPNALFAGLISQ